MIWLINNHRSWTLVFNPLHAKLLKGLCGCMTAILRRYKSVDWTLTRHFIFNLGPLDALQTLHNHAAIVLTTISPPGASAPRELCYCIVSVVILYIYLWVASVNCYCLTQLGSVTVQPFSCILMSDYPFNVTWLVLPTGCVKVLRVNMQL